jgi:lipopolysaccharide transport system ATP-binding protein
MTGAPIIQVENLSKMYRLGEVGTGTLSHDLKRWYYRTRGWEDPYLKIGEVNDREKSGTSEYVWALKDVNLEVKQGEVLGIVGRNGAGKSTLLKLLSKVTGPTSGAIHYNGRIGALLEVGTGFHPELTGRENIFLNGAILGMTKLEIKSKLDEIVDFSGVSRYLDTPVKRYSSGMMVRLGFAVAAHLEPEILIVDEVLAVGDAAFQKKAIGKMQDISKEGGRTVLFVSHNMAAVQTLCSTAIGLENGMVTLSGPANEVVSEYLRKSYFGSEVAIQDRSDRKGRGLFKFKTLHLENSKKEKIGFACTGEEIYFKMTFDVKDWQQIEKVPLEIGILIRDSQGTLVTTLASFFTDQSPVGQESIKEVTCHIAKLPLLEGQYHLDLWCATSTEDQDWIENAFQLRIEAGNYFNSVHTWRPRHDRHGPMVIDQNWYHARSKK